MTLNIQNLTIGYNHFAVQSCLNATAQSGNLISLIGRNGSGKSTLLRTLAGLQKPLKGNITLTSSSPLTPALKATSSNAPAQYDLTTLPPSKRALLLSLVLTEHLALDNTRVSDIVAMGRYQHSSFLGGLSEQDKHIIYESLINVDAESKANCFYSQLSDGEKQRVLIAKAIAQQTPLILLDEPTSYLDLPNRIKIMSLLKKIAAEQNKIIIISTHELDLAMQMADSIWLMSKNEILGSGLYTGSPTELVESGIFEQLFSDNNFSLTNENGQIRIHIKAQ